METIKNIITERGGRFIELKIIEKLKNNKKTKRKFITFECENGHITEKRLDSFRKIHKGKNTWCKECRKKTIEDCHELAKKHNGKCLSKIYINSKTKY